MNASRCDTSAVSYLLEGGHNPDSRDSDGVTAGLRAIEGGGSNGDEAACIETLAMLVSYGADLADPDEDGTPVLAWLLVGNNGAEMLGYLQQRNIELCGTLPSRWVQEFGVSNLAELADRIEEERPTLAAEVKTVVDQCELN